jgi:hypothetical protein
VVVVVINVHTPTEVKSGDTKDNFYEELECIFSWFQTNHMNILLGDFNAESFVFLPLL